MTTPFPGEKTAKYYNLPTPGEYVRIRGLVSTTYLRRGETMVIRWSDWWSDLIVRNYVTVVALVEEPSASEYFPTLDAVWELIELGATTLPGEKILGLQATDRQIVATVGMSDEYSRTYAVDWPEMELLFQEITKLRDHTQELSNNATRALADGTEDLKNILVDYNGIASAAAEISLSAAERAEASGGESGMSAYEIAVKYGYQGSEEQWVSSLEGPEGPVGPRGPQGVRGEDGTSIAVTGTVPTADDLPTEMGDGEAGQGWVSQDDGHLHVWDGSSWSDVGPVRGPEGERGPAGEDGEDGTSFLVQGHVPTSQDLPVDAETGTAYVLADGTAVQRFAGGWGNPVPFRGPEGPVGPRGATGAQGVRGDDGDDGADGVPFLVQGTVADMSALPDDPTLGHAYIFDDGNAVQWLGADWSEPIAFRGPQGPQGEQGTQGLRGYQGIQGERGPRGVEGPQGTLTDEQKRAIFGSVEFNQKPHGYLVFTSGPYFPPDGFSRLRRNTDGWMRVDREYGGSAEESVLLSNPCLIAPVDGLYWVGARQIWSNGGGGTKGVGLGSSLTDGASQMVTWADGDTFNYVETSNVVSLTAGTRLYPWIWSHQAGDVLPNDRGMDTYFGIVYMGGN